MAEENEIIQKKSWTDPVTGKFIKGNPGGGRPKGSLDFKTKFYRAIDKIAEQNGLTPDEVEEQLILVGYKKAKEGDYSFYRDVMDRIHGKPMQPTDITSGGEKLQVMFDQNFNANTTLTPNSDNNQQEKI